MDRPEPSQERSRRRREALLRAAIELVAEGGVKQVSHRAVAARAGVPLAATTYYFSSIQQLTEEALRLHVEERVAEMTRLSQRAARSGGSVEAVANRFADALAGRDRDAVLGQFELYLEAARTPSLRGAVRDALDAFERLAETSLATLGARDPRAAAAAFLALIDGFALHRLARPRRRAADAEALLDGMRALFIAFAMPVAEREKWHERFRSEPPALPPATRS